MTKSEAIEILNNIPTKGEEVDAIEIAISALEKEAGAAREGGGGMKCDACKLKPKCDDLERAGILPKIEDCRAFVPLPTNADRLRAMSDEELAEFLCDLRSNGSDGCDNCHAHDSCWAGHTGFIDWLRKEADT